MLQFKIKNQFLIHQFAQFKQLFNNLNNSVHIFLNFANVAHICTFIQCCTFVQLCTISHILHNFANIDKFCTLCMHNLAHFWQYCTCYKFYTILHMSHNSAHVAQFWTLGIILHIVYNLHNLPNLSQLVTILNKWHSFANLA